VLSDFSFYDLFITAFMQLMVTTVLVFSGLRNLENRLRWSGSRILEILVGAAMASGLAALACVLAIVVWGLPAQGAQGAAFVLALVSILVVIARQDVSVVGKVFSAAYAAAGFTYLGYSGVVVVNATRSIGETITAFILILLGVGSFMVWYSNINYVSDVMCRTRPSRPLPKADPNHQPFVSIHMPAYNEPPELFIETIKAVEQIDYPNFEIVVIDNNTTDAAVWGPVEEYCRDKERITFVHVAPWPGYKAGACNLALREYTDPRAEIIGLVDADDLVQPHYLKEVAPYFCDDQVGFIQTFEGNRDYEGSDYYTAVVDSYQGFYLGVMSSRNERDSVPFVGTMGLFRRSALEDVGGWNEWCICEDTEASVRVLKAGWSGLYIPRCFGRGIVPPTFRGLNTQRHRWCFGGMQILRLHWRSLMPWDRSPDNHLTSAQRRDYLMSGLSWFRDPLMLGFALLLLVVTGLLLADSSFALMPVAGEAALLPASLILIATVCMTWTLRQWTSITRRRTLRALVVSLSAAWITSLACIQGLTYREGRFLVTSKKGADRRPLRMALRLSRVETVLSLALFGAAGMLIAAGKTPALLMIVMLVQAMVYLCSPISALWNMRAQRVPAERYRRRHAERLARAQRRRPHTFVTTRFAGALLVAVVAGGLLAATTGSQKLVPVSAITEEALEESDGAKDPITLQQAPDDFVVPGIPLVETVIIRPAVAER
jgi:cellulose synthase/poly-beta-1,6-N-acetylglucosamine synthase-like glycosyltransferase